MGVKLHCVCANGKTHKQKNGMDNNVSEYAVICLLTALFMFLDNGEGGREGGGGYSHSCIFTTVTMFKMNATMYREAGVHRHVYFNPQHASWNHKVLLSSAF